MRRRSTACRPPHVCASAGLLIPRLPLALLCLASTLLLLAPHGVLAACRIRLDLDAAASPLLLSSTNALLRTGTTGTPLSSFATFNASIPRAWTGALYATSASLPSCPAPADRPAWLAAWPSFSISSATADSDDMGYSQPLDINPALHLGKTALAGLAGTPSFDYNVSDFRIEMRVSDVAAAAPGSGSSGSWSNFTGGAVRTKLVSGWLNSRNSVTGSRFDNLENNTANATAVPMGWDLRTAGGRSTLYMELPTLSLTYQAVSRITAFNTLYDSFANFTLASRITAKALLDCPSYCGDFGRCSADSGSSPACVCDCGWTVGPGGQCTLPWGYCSTANSSSEGGGGSGQVAATSPVPVLAPPLPPAPKCVADGNTTSSARSIPSVNGVCPNGYDWDPYGVLCNACPAGFSGSGCASCNSDTACKESLGSSAAQCLLSPIYRPRTARKVYSCDLLDPAVSGILGNSIDFTCSTTRPTAAEANVTGLTVGAGIVSSNTPVGASPYCRMSFRLSGMPRDASVICTGWACEFTVNSSRVYCPVIKCECPKGCSNADGTITEVTFTSLTSAVSIVCGNEANMDATSSVDGTTGCRIELTGLPITAIPASCKTSECMDPVNGTVAVTMEPADKKEPLALAPIIAWIPTMALLLVAATAVAATASFVSAAAPAGRGSAAADGSGGGGGAGAAAGPVGEGTEGDAAPAAAEAVPPPVIVAVEEAEIAPQAPPSYPPALPPLPQPTRPQQQHLLPGQLVTPCVGSPRADGDGGMASGGGSASDGAAAAAAAFGNAGGAGVGDGADIHICGGGGGVGSGSSKEGPTGSSGSSGGGGGHVVALPAAAPSAAAAGKGSSPCHRDGAVAAASDSDEDASRPLVQELSWHGLSVSTWPRRSALPPWRVQPAATLLQDVSGRAASGEVLGILGPSGSGKTTLLSTLAGLLQPGLHWQVSGVVALDGRPVGRSGRHLAALVGHVPQHDLLARSLTVAECVAASAALRMSRMEVARGRAHVESRVYAILRELGIDHLAHRVVWPGGGTTLTGGGGGGTLSGGERLRVAAALELVADPPLLLLDEPLSGLDSATARATMAVLRAVAAGSGNGGAGAGGGGGGGGRIVVASLHQPSPALFSALDCVLLMAGGRVAYFGPPGGVAAAVAEAGLPAAPHDVPLADHLLDLVVAGDHHKAWGFSGGSGGGGGAERRLCEHWAASSAASKLAAPSAPKALDAAGAGTVGNGIGTRRHHSGSAAADGCGSGDADGPSYVRSLVRARGGGSGLRARLRRAWLELGVLTWRCGLDMLRNPAMTALHLGVTSAIGLLVGAVFSNTALNVSGAQNRVGAIFFAVMLLACFATSAVDGVYPERAIVDRDLLRRSYGIMPYMIARLVLDGVLLRLLPSWCFSLPFYWLMGLRPQAAAFFTFMGAFTTMSCLAGASCIALSFVFSSPGKTVLVLNLLLLVCALFSGFLANKDVIVGWLRWIVYISPIRFCWEALVINELKPLVLNFSSPDLPAGLPAVRGGLFLSLLGVDSSLLTTDLIVLGCMYGIVVIAAMAAAALRLVGLRGRWK